MLVITEIHLVYIFVTKVVHWAFTLLADGYRCLQHGLLPPVGKKIAAPPPPKPISRGCRLLRTILQIILDKLLTIPVGVAYRVIIGNTIHYSHSLITIYLAHLHPIPNVTVCPINSNTLHLMLSVLCPINPPLALSTTPTLDSLTLCRKGICHFFNLSLLESVCPQAWSEAKVIPLPKNSKAPFTGSNS